MRYLKKILFKIKLLLNLPFEINNKIGSIKDSVASSNQLCCQINYLINKVDDSKIINAKVLSYINSTRTPDIINNIQLAEFRVFSQWGDDGIIQFLVNYLDIDHRVFIEFGIESYQEANTRFLLVNNNWSGLVFDGSQNNIDYLKHDDIYWRYDIKAKTLFITKDNINEAIKAEGISGDIGLLHIDIDGNDYWVWKEISAVSPVIAIIEYNSVFGATMPWTTPYDKNFQRTKKHYSNLYFGSSLLSLCDLAKKKGYVFVGCNSNGNNAYFVRQDKLKKLKQLDPKKDYVESKFRESLSPSKCLSFISGQERLKILEGLPIFNTRKEKIEKITCN